MRDPLYFPQRTDKPSGGMALCGWCSKRVSGDRVIANGTVYHDECYRVRQFPTHSNEPEQAIDRIGTWLALHGGTLVVGAALLLLIFVLAYAVGAGWRVK